MSQPEMRERCADLSYAAGESLFATAVTATSWLLLEVPGPWPRDVSSAGALPEAAQQAVSAWLEATPGSRLQFLRRPGRATQPPLAFVVRADESRQAIRRIELERHEDLGSLDLDTAGESVGGSLVLVCGHGSRDQCCALRGTAVFGALDDRLGEEELWFSSHQGGHRFAANVLVLPAALQFGRVETSGAPFLVARALAGRIELGHYRGRTFYEPAVQAAEHAVRALTSLDGVDEVRLEGVADGRARFRAGDTEWAVLVEPIDGPRVPASCGDEPAPQRAFVARVL
jgi:hypothetical protein